MNNFIAKNLIYFPVQYLRGQKVKKYIASFDGIQYQKAEELERIQSEKLKKVINYAYYNNRFYRDRFDKVNVKPGEINSLHDLIKIPVLSKNEIIENEKKMIGHAFDKKLHVRKTGGSTGMTLHFMKENDALAKNDAIMYRCYKWYGIDIGDKQVRFWGVPVSAKLRWHEQLKDFILNRIRISAFDISSSSCMRQYDWIKKFKPDYFYGYTTAIYGFCLFMKENGVRLNEKNLKAVICTAEKMYPHHRKLFDEVFNCPVVDEYGSAEHGIIAFQCKKGNMHLMSDHLAIEFLDEKGQPVNVGEAGRIVITDLSSYAMPLIRYDIGDVGRYCDRRCSCGINLPLMEMVEGRKEDFIKTKEGKLIHAAYLCYTLKDDTVHEFKMYQKGLEDFYVQIVKSPNFNNKSEKMLESKLRTALGKDVKITFDYLDRIPRESSGKLRYFVSECE